MGAFNKPKINFKQKRKENSRKKRQAMGLQQKHKDHMELVKSRTKKHAKKAARKARAADELAVRLAGGEVDMADAASPTAAAAGGIRAAAGRKGVKVGKRAKLRLKRTKAGKKEAAAAAAATAAGSSGDAMAE